MPPRRRPVRRPRRRPDSADLERLDDPPAVPSDEARREGPDPGTVDEDHRGLGDVGCRLADPHAGHPGAPSRRLPAGGGLTGGALAAALYLSGQEPAQMLNAIAAAADLGKKLLPMQRPAQRAIRGGEPAFFRSGKLERMLEEHTGRRLLAVSPRTGVFLCRFVRTGRHVIFSTRAYPQEGGAMLNMQTSIGFAARAAAALPPFLAPVSWMGSPLLPETDLDFACRQLFLLGAQRALIIRPVLSVHTPPDVVDLTSMALAYGMDRMPQKGCTAVLNIPMPDGVGALSFQKMPACVRAGKETAEQQLDQLLEQMGMAYGRILPFKGQRR